MPRLPAISPRKLTQFLEAHGFILDHTSGSHFVFYNNLTKKRAVVAKHNRDVPIGTMLSILRESGFSREDFLKFFRR